MPRIYYNEEDWQIQTAFYVFHAVIYIGGVSFLWATSLTIAPAVTIIWTYLLCYHNYWRMSLEDSMQQRTYDRLRNRFGLDWDLEARTEDFDFEYKKTILEAKLRHSLPDTLAAIAFAPLIVVFVLLGLLDSLSLAHVGNALLGGIVLLSVLQISLRVQLRQQASDYATMKKKHADTASTQLRDVNRHPRAGMTYAVGDDGELIEIPHPRQQSSRQSD